MKEMIVGGMHSDKLTDRGVLNLCIGNSDSKLERLSFLACKQPALILHSLGHLQDNLPERKLKTRKRLKMASPKMHTYMKNVSVSNPSSNSTIWTVSLKTGSMKKLPAASL